MRGRELVSGTFIALICASTALAADIEETAAPVSDWSLSVGIGGGLAPDYEGADEYKAIPLPLFDLRYNGMALRTSRFGLEADLVPGEAFQAGPILRYNTGRDSDVKDEVVRLLPEVGAAAELGAFAATGLPLSVLGMDSPSIVTARIGFIQGQSGGHEGLTIDGSLGLVTPVSDQLTIISALSATWMSNTYADSFFGVTPAGSAASGLAAFDPGSGIKDVGVTLIGSYEVTDAWSVTGIASYTRLLGDAADSPVVSQRGSANQLFGGLGISYKIW